MQWHTPIGYCVREGQIMIDDEKSKIVIQIFQEYDGGISAMIIASNLKKKGVMNKNDRVKWTHATVGRILEDDNYLGNEYYPQLISTELFERVQERREQKRQKLGRGEYRPSKRERNLFGGILRCGECGEAYSHIMPKKKCVNQKPKWKCKNYVYHNQLCSESGDITDKEVMEVCRETINQMIRDRSLLKIVAKRQETVTPRYRELDQMIKYRQHQEFESFTDMLYARAAERYRTLRINDTEEKTQVMLDTLEGVAEQESFQEQLYRKLIKEIIVNKDQTATVILYNGSSITNKYRKKEGATVHIRKGAEDDNETCQKSEYDSCNSPI